MPEFHGDLTKEKFFLEWFGLIGGRDLGTNKEPHRKFTDNPEDLLIHIKECSKERRPIWVSTQPTRLLHKEMVGEAMAIERLFFDFDDNSKHCSKCDEYIHKDNLVSETINGKKVGGLCPKCKSECVEKPRIELIAKEVARFLDGVKRTCRSEGFVPTPFIVKTYKGFHVYYFLTDIFKFEPVNLEKAKELYELLQKNMMDNTYPYEFLDTHLLGNINSMARVPKTPHEKTGEICEVLDENLEITKIRHLDYYRSYGVPTSFVKRTIEIMNKRLTKKQQEEKEDLEKFEKNVPNGNGNGVEYGHGIRPCFKARMEKGEANHAFRLAWLSEIYYNGYNTIDKMIELCRQTWSDFKEKISRQQVEDYFKHERYLYHPYKCATIREKGWCLGEEECQRIRRMDNTNK